MLLLLVDGLCSEPLGSFRSNRMQSVFGRCGEKTNHEVVERRASGGGLQLDQPPTLRLDVACIDHVISDVVIHEIFRAQ